MGNNNEKIYDNGKLRNCAKNHFLCGFWGTWYHFHSFKNEFNRLVEATPELFKSIGFIFLYILFLCMLPFNSFIRAFHTWRRAVKEVKRSGD